MDFKVLKLRSTNEEFVTNAIMIWITLHTRLNQENLHKNDEKMSAWLSARLRFFKARVSLDVEAIEIRVRDLQGEKDPEKPRPIHSTDLRGPCRSRRAWAMLNKHRYTSPTEPVHTIVISWECYAEHCNHHTTKLDNQWEPMLTSEWRFWLIIFAARSSIDSAQGK